MSTLDFVKVPIIFLNTCGLYLPKDTKKMTPIFLFYLTLGSGVIINCIGSINCARVKIQQQQDLAIVGRHLFPIFFYLSCLAKTLSVLSARQVLSELLNDLDEHLPRTPQHQSEYQYKKYLNKSKRLSNVFAFLQVASLWYISVSSILIQYGANDGFALPYGDHYPFYRYHPVTFWVVFVIQLSGPYAGAIMVFGTNFLFYGMVFQIMMHYQHLISRIESFEKELKGKNGKPQLIWCIKKQNHLNGSIHQLNDIFAISTIIGLACSCGILVLYCFMGMNLSTFNDFIQYVFGSLSSALEISVMCWFGQKIADSSVSIGGAMYGNEWYGRDLVHKRAMIMMIQQDQRPIFLEAYKFAGLTMELFTIVMKLNYRLITLLNNTGTGF